jgi:acyl-CoA reductase-like NAD-dependent aldehyde dehydrogenase
MDLPTAAADAASAAFPAWSATGPNARRALLNKAADALEALADQFVAASFARPSRGRGSTLRSAPEWCAKPRR